MKLKNPIELIIYTRQTDEICAVSYYYETESWELQPNKWIKIIKDTKTERVPEEILDLNGLGMLIHKKFDIN